MYSLAAEQDVDIEDDLARAQKRLRELKARISAQSKKNFVLERDVRYLDSRIALLIQNKMAAEEKRQVAETLEEVDGDEEGVWLDEKRQGQYANLFFLLQSEPRHVASLCRLVSLAEIDTLLQSVMFTLFGNQYEQREEHLLLTMFQVCLFICACLQSGATRGEASAGMERYCLVRSRKSTHPLLEAKECSSSISCSRLRRLLTSPQRISALQSVWRCASVPCIPAHY